ncbi:hypothetical protein [Nocardia seriolae]|uniref:Uncharacterized protein n=1 Tax=Nocardia seriolae TaxID=37332 RepID=A0A0B8NPP4_9NOCA|nr:hypothetical protein [Nocardia seriolae]APA96258.1 hypothetical protein NS506_02191 [Nocardia seriolae]MTJ65673.1 hypothetical protein [Nocardia seriolae]MTJ75691.1 hypothetical protein [Nocardia seriolae]MTJ86398.1 hypothetical protein [Nocardia seriolae]MTK30391.1 hypothetical protein [Nocardia seriolae]
MNSNSIVKSIATGSSAGRCASAPVMSVASASRGILAFQGIRMSGVNGDLGLQVFASKAQADQQIVIKQDKPKGDWRPAAAYVAVENLALKAGLERPVHLTAVRPNTTDPATVIRSRHRSRLR